MKNELIRELFTMLVINTYADHSAHLARVKAIRQAVGQEVYDAVATCARMALPTYKRVAEKEELERSVNHEE